MKPPALYQVWTNKNSNIKWELDSTYEDPERAFRRAKEWETCPSFMHINDFLNTKARAIVVRVRSFEFKTNHSEEF